MAYVKDTYIIGDVLDHEIKARGLYGKPGEKRGKRSKATPEQIKKQNHHNRTKYIFRVLLLNFEEHFSTFVTLTYRRELRPETIEQVKKDKKNFLDAMKREYKKRGVEMKWICRIEVGKRGGKHMHLILNDIPGVDMKKLISSHWKKGNPDIKDVYDLKSNSLAEYFTKIPDEMAGQITWMDDKDAVSAIGCTCSRNLKKPEAVRKEYKRKTLEQDIRYGIRPTNGYCVDKNSIRYGINPFTGYTYLYYREYRLKKGEEPIRFIPEMKGEPPWSV